MRAAITPKRVPRSRKGFAAPLVRIEEVIELEVPVEFAALKEVLIDEVRSERLDVVPQKFRVEGKAVRRVTATRVAVRQERAAPVATGLFELWGTEQRKVCGKPRTAESIRYALNLHAALERFLVAGRNGIGSNLLSAQSGPEYDKEQRPVRRKRRRLSHQGNALHASSDLSDDEVDTLAWLA